MIRAMAFCVLLLPVCFGIEKELKYIVIITTESKLECNGLIRTSAVLQTLCSCVMTPKGKGIEALPNSYIKVITADGVKRVSRVLPHPKCRIVDAMFVFNSALVFLETQIDLMEFHEPVREPAFPPSEFDAAMKLKLPCELAGAQTVVSYPAFLSDCIKIESCTDPACAYFLAQMTFCMQPVNQTQPAITGAPLICRDGLAWGVKLSDYLNFTLFMKITAFEELEKSSSPYNLISLHLLSIFLFELLIFPLF